MVLTPYWEHAPNLQDKMVGEMFRQRRLELTVQGVEVAEAGRLRIVLDEGYAVDAMPDDSTAGEHWRLFVPRKEDPHFIFTGNGIESE